MRFATCCCLLALLAPVFAAEDLAWVRITYEMPDAEHSCSYTGALPRSLLTAIEEDRHAGRFLLLRELRYWHGDEERYLPFADDYESGVALIPVARILLVDYLQDDPLVIQGRLDERDGDPPADDPEDQAPPPATRF